MSGARNEGKTARALRDLRAFLANAKARGKVGAVYMSVYAARELGVDLDAIGRGEIDGHLIVGNINGWIGGQ